MNKHTLGPAVARELKDKRHRFAAVMQDKTDGGRIAACDGGFGCIATDEESLANAELFAEAINVATETGLTPRQLADRVKELEEALALCITNANCAADYAGLKGMPNSDTLTLKNAPNWPGIRTAIAILAKVQS